MENTLEKQTVIVGKAMEKLKPAVDKSAAESKGAASVEETKKTEGLKVADVEAKAQEDERILSTDEKELSAEDKTRKTELLEVKQKKENTPEEKIKRVQEASQKRIDEIKSELLEERNKRTQDAVTIKRLESEMAEVKKAIAPKVEQDEKARQRQIETERINKYVEEDKTKPYEDRREMSKDELENWYLEDPIAVDVWISERTLRRVDERKKIVDEEATKANGKQLSEEFVKKQNENLDKLCAKYPGIRPTESQLASLRGKSQAEMDASLRISNEEYRICMEIGDTDPKKYYGTAEGPLLMIAEMDKRLGKAIVKAGANGKKIELTEEELQERVQAEIDRRAGLDEGITSTNGGKKVDKEQNKSQLRQKQELIAEKAGISVEQLDKTINRRKSIPGSSHFEHEGE